MPSLFFCSPVIGSISDTSLARKLQTIGKKRLEVSGAGHCLLYAVVLALDSDTIASVDILKTMILYETRANLARYEEFYNSMDNDNSLVQEVDRYLQKRAYDSDASDILLPIICNVTRTTLSVLEVQGRKTVEISHSPSHDRSSQIIHLLRSGSAGNEHYDALVSVAKQEEDEVIVLSDDSEDESKWETPKQFVRKGRTKFPSPSNFDSPSRFSPLSPDIELDESDDDDDVAPFPTDKQKRTINKNSNERATERNLFDDSDSDIVLVEDSVEENLDDSRRQTDHWSESTDFRLLMSTDSESDSCVDGNAKKQKSMPIPLTRWIATDWEDVDGVEFRNSAKSYNHIYKIIYRH